MDNKDPIPSVEFENVALVPDIVTEARRKNCQDPLPNLLEHLPEQARQNVNRKIETAIQEEVCKLSDDERKLWKQSIGFSVCAMPYVSLQFKQANRSANYLFSDTKRFHKEMKKWLAKYPNLPNARYRNHNGRVESLKSLIDYWCQSGTWFADYGNMCVEISFQDADLTLDELMQMDQSIDFEIKGSLIM